MTPPVIFIVFNRPATARRVLERIREACPSKLLVVCDGPRPHVPTDSTRVAEVREIIEEGVNWPCEVITNYAESNMGCRARVSSGLNWAFSLVEEAIILEDDCLPDPSFFSFCEEMLKRYGDNARVMHISGSNFAAPFLKGKSSYWFSHQPIIWGWATWRRAWKHYDLEMSTWESRLDDLRSSFSSRWETHFWLPILNETRIRPESSNTWDFSWTYTCRSLHGLCVTPRKNMVENIGYGADSTHTADENSSLQLPANSCGPIRHPQKILRDPYADELLTMIWSGQRINPISRLRSRIRIMLDQFRK